MNWNPNVLKNKHFDWNHVPSAKRVGFVIYTATSHLGGNQHVLALFLGNCHVTHRLLRWSHRWHCCLEWHWVVWGNNTLMCDLELLCYRKVAIISECWHWKHETDLSIIPSDTELNFPSQLPIMFLMFIRKRFADSRFELTMWIDHWDIDKIN